MHTSYRIRPIKESQSLKENCSSQLNLPNLPHIPQEFEEKLIQGNIHQLLNLEQRPCVLVRLIFQELRDSKLSDLSSSSSTVISIS